MDSVTNITKISEIPATAPAANWYRNGSGFALLVFEVCVVISSVVLMHQIYCMIKRDFHASHSLLRASPL
jgi:hypothetical protein